MTSQGAGSRAHLPWPRAHASLNLQTSRALARFYSRVGKTCTACFVCALCALLTRTLGLASLCPVGAAPGGTRMDRARWTAVARAQGAWKCVRLLPAQDQACALIAVVLQSLCSCAVAQRLPPSTIAFTHTGFSAVSGFLLLHLLLHTRAPIHRSHTLV